MTKPTSAAACWNQFWFREKSPSEPLCRRCFSVQIVFLSDFGLAALRPQ
jgi:hypothetical protein